MEINYEEKIQEILDFYASHIPGCYLKVLEEGWLSEIYKIIYNDLLKNDENWKMVDSINKCCRKHLAGQEWDLELDLFWWSVKYSKGWWYN